MNSSQSESLKAIVADLAGYVRKINKNFEHLSNALSTGDPLGSSKYLEEFTALLTKTGELRDRATSEIQEATTSISGIAELRQQCLDAAQIRFDGHKVFLSEGALIVFPVVAKFENSKDEYRVIINGETNSTISVEHILDLIAVQLKDNFDASRFLRSLFGAYKTISNMTGKTSISLEDIRQVLSVTKDSVNTYSRETFESDLQRWNASDVKTISGKTARLEHVAASRDGYPIISPNGARANLSNIKFE